MWAEAGEQEHKTVLISPAALATDEPITIMRNFLLQYVMFSIFSLYWIYPVVYLDLLVIGDYRNIIFLWEALWGRPQQG